MEENKQTENLPKFEINPLMQAPVTERDYTGGKIDYQDHEEIPEFQETHEISQEAENTEGTQKEPFNETFNELPNKEKKQGAELAADTLLDAYSGMCGLGVKVVSISEKRIKKEYAEGTIDPGLRLPTEDNQTVSVMEYAESFNSTIAEAFEVSDEFKEKVKAPLVRVLQKRGIAMSDEQFLMYAFGKDLGEKALIAVSLKIQTREMLSMLREQTEHMKKGTSKSDFTPENSETDNSYQEVAVQKPEIVKPEPITAKTNQAKKRLAKAQDGKKKQDAHSLPAPEKEQAKEATTEIFIKKTTMEGATSIGTPMSQEDLAKMERISNEMKK